MTYVGASAATMYAVAEDVGRRLSRHAPWHDGNAEVVGTVSAYFDGSDGWFLVMCSDVFKGKSLSERLEYAWNRVNDCLAMDEQKKVTRIVCVTRDEDADAHFAYHSKKMADVHGLTSDGQ